MSKIGDDSPKDILVIGSTNHSHATCANWMDDFPNIKEFDAVIVYMPSLSQVTLDYLDDLDISKTGTRSNSQNLGVLLYFRYSPVGTFIPSFIKERVEIRWRNTSYLWKALIVVTLFIGSSTYWGLAFRYLSAFL